MLANGCPFLIGQFPRPSLIYPPTDPCDCAHEGRVRISPIHDILHIRVDVTGQIVIQERANISVLHDQILFRFAHRAYQLQEISSMFVLSVQDPELVP